MKKYYIYIHTKLNGEVFYVGKGVNNRAYSTHHRNRLWHYIAKSGYNIIITDYYETKEEYDIAEIELIAEYRSLGCELVNQTIGGDGGSSGRVWSMETRKRLSENVKGKKNPMFGRKLSDAERKERSERIKGEKNVFFGEKHSEETKKKMRASWEKRKLIGVSEETRKKLSIARSGKNNPRYEKTVSEETKKKISLAMAGRKLSDDHKRKIVRKKRKPSISTELSNFLIET